MLAHLLQVGDELGIPGVEAGAEAGQVRPLRQRVDGDHAVESVLEDRAGRTVPRELAAALVAEHRDPVRATPLRRGRQVVEGPSRVGRAVDPQHERPGGVLGIDGVEARTEVAVHRHRNRTAPGQRGPHLVRRAARRGAGPCPDQACAAGATGEACRPVPSCRRRRRSAGRHVDAEPSRQPPARCRAAPAYRCWAVAALSEESAATTDAGGGSHGVPTERSTTPPGSWSATSASVSSRS